MTVNLVVSLAWDVLMLSFYVGQRQTISLSAGVMRMPQH